MIGPIARAILKNFIRSRSALFVLFVLPLLLISGIFLSFNPNGMRPLPAGLIAQNGLTVKDIDSSLSFLRFSEYWDVPSCLRDLKLHRVYACAKVYKTDKIIVQLYYDNTQDPVIWEVVQKAQMAVRDLANQQRTQTADNLVNSLGPVGSSLKNMSNATSRTIGEVVSFHQQLDTAQVQLAQGSAQLNSDLVGMDQDIASARTSLSSARTARDQSVSDAQSAVSGLSSLVFAIQSSATNNATRAQAGLAVSDINQLSTAVNQLSTASDTYLNDANAKLDSYASKSADGHRAVGQMRSYSSKLRIVSTQVSKMTTDLHQSKQQLDELSASVDAFRGLDRTSLIDPVVLEGAPVYVPHAADKANVTAAEIVHGFNLLSYQTLFPNLLMLVVLFFTVLVSSFMTLSHLNAPAHVRIRIVPRSSVSDFFAIWISSMVIALSSVLAVYVLGLLVFQIGITASSVSFFLVVLAIALSMSLLGILVVYAVRTESMSLILSMFAVVGLLFGSGFILPIERMSDWAFSLAHLNPVWIGMDSFDRVIFYGAPVSSLGAQFVVLAGWFVLLGALVFVVKRWRRL